jgi:hypothetical protein
VELAILVLHAKRYREKPEDLNTFVLTHKYVTMRRKHLGQNLSQGTSPASCTVNERFSLSDG